MSTNNRIGPHIGLQGSFTDTLKALPKGCDCFQTFIGAPLNYNLKKFDAADLASAGKFLHTNNMQMYVHAPYVINLANPEKYAPGRACLQKYLDTLAQVSPTHTGTILHIGANGSLEHVADQLNSMNISSPLYLENCAGEGSKLGKTMAELQKLMDLTDSHRVGICIDTCHAHSAGLTDMRDTRQVVKLFDDLPDDRATMFHLNDSKVDYNAKVDRHMPVGDGTIWSHNKESLTTFADLANITGRDIVLETPSLTLREMNWLRSVD
jgi:deoxyribonuclease-4